MIGENIAHHFGVREHPLLKARTLLVQIPVAVYVCVRQTPVEDEYCCRMLTRMEEYRCHMRTSTIHGSIVHKTKVEYGRVLLPYAHECSNQYKSMEEFCCRMRMSAVNDRRVLQTTAKLTCALQLAPDHPIITFTTAGTQTTAGRGSPTQIHT